MNESGVWNWLEATAGNSNNWWLALMETHGIWIKTLDFSFKLLGSRVNGVPEPSMLPLLALGLFLCMPVRVCVDVPSVKAFRKYCTS